MNIEILNLTLVQLIVISAFALFFVIQMVYYCVLFVRVAFYRHKPQQLDAVSQEGISVVICARNESGNLSKLLPKILEQGHPAFEVIVVNDCSTDHSEDVLTELQSTYANLVVRAIELEGVFEHNNAMAWGVGIRAATYDWVVLTDTNCYPENGNWLAALQQNFLKGTDVVLSYTHINRSLMARADNFFDGLFYLSKACAGKPYTGSGDNIAFRKSLFFDNRGFHSLLKICDKADRIFVNTIANKGNAVVDLTPDAVNYSSLPLNYKRWQRKRRDDLRSQRLFRNGTKYAGCFELASRSAYYLLFAAAIVCLFTVQWALITTLSLFGARLLMQILIFAKAQKRLKEKRLLFFSLLWDVISPVIYLPIVILSKFERR